MWSSSGGSATLPISVCDCDAGSSGVFPSVRYPTPTPVLPTIFTGQGLDGEGGEGERGKYVERKRKKRRGMLNREREINRRKSKRKAHLRF